MGAARKDINRIAKNSAFLYIRMFFLMAVSLYTSRIILNALGIEDYGIHNAVAGFVSMFSIVSASLTSAISRFLTFELGSGSPESVRKVFSTSINIQIVLIVFILLIAETLGVWFLNNRMTIPLDRVTAAGLVFQFSLIAFCTNLISIPYNAVIIAHEDMSAFAGISIIESLLKLCIAFFISISHWDKLILYSFLITAVSVIVRLIYGIYCRRHYSEIRYSFILDRKLFREMISFAGWNYLGAGASILRTHGINLLMNIFFGAAVNAARGIATQVESTVTQFVGNFTMAVNPQIIKSYSADDLPYMHRLVCVGAKYSFFLMLVIAVPLFIEAPYILDLWLKTVPDGTVLFLRLALLAILADTLSKTSSTAIAASGQVKSYNITASVIVIMVFPLTYISYRLGAKAYICYIFCIVAMIIKLFVLLPILRDTTGMKPSVFIRSVMLKTMPPLAAVPILPFIMHRNMEEGFIRLVAVCLVSLIWGAVCIYATGTSSDEREWIREKLHNKPHGQAQGRLPDN